MPWLEKKERGCVTRGTSARHYSYNVAFMWERRKVVGRAEAFNQSRREHAREQPLKAEEYGKQGGGVLGGPGR